MVDRDHDIGSEQDKIVARRNFLAELRSRYERMKVADEKLQSKLRRMLEMNQGIVYGLAVSFVVVLSDEARWWVEHWVSQSQASLVQVHQYGTLGAAVVWLVVLLPLLLLVRKNSIEADQSARNREQLEYLKKMIALLESD